MRTISAVLDERARASFSKAKLGTYGKTMKLTVAGSYTEYDWAQFVVSVNKLWAAASN